MYHDTRPFTASSPVATVLPGFELRKRRGRTAYQRGLAAEQSVENRYVAAGATVVGRRVRTPHGELDLILQDGDFLVFVEVKARRRSYAMDSPISATQWQRLKNAVLHYMFSAHSQTGVQPACRFDVALVDTSGTVTVHENACGFDEH